MLGQVLRNPVRIWAAMLLPDGISPQRLLSPLSPRAAVALKARALVMDLTRSAVAILRQDIHD